MKQKSISPKTISFWLTLLMIVSVATMVVHGYLTLQHYQLKLGLSDGKSLCNISSTFNCDSVAISAYATLWSIPMALLGLMTQVVFFILLVATRFQLSSTTDTLRRTLFWMSTFVFAVSVVMGGISSLALGTYCLYCMAAYALSLVQLVGAWKIQEEAPLPHLSEDVTTLATTARWVPILLVLIPALSWMSHSVLLNSYGFGRLKIAIEDSLVSWDSSPALPFQEDRGLVLQKDSGPANMVIVEFADFLCPHCKTASPSLEAFTQSHPGVKLVFKTFPLDGKCNKSIQRLGDGQRCRLSASMVCAEKMAKKGWDAHHWIFERQEKLYTASWDSVSADLTKDLALEKSAFDACLNADDTQETILAMAQEGSSISGTPTVFVNGKLLPRGQVLPVLEAVYKKLNP